MAFAPNVTLRSALPNIEIPPPQDERKGHTGKRSSGSGETPILLALNAAHDSRYKLTQQDDCKQAESLREVSSVRREFHAVLDGQPGSQKVDGQCQRPDQ